jgi:putative RNA 2'-phosphotransferase
LLTSNIIIGTCFVNAFLLHNVSRDQDDKGKMMRQRQQRQESLAKLLSYILCRRPDEFGLVLDETGRLPVKELLWALGQEEGWGYVRRSHLEEVVNLVSPGAFVLEQNHIWAVAPGPAQLRTQDPGWPPPLLYRAITARSHEVVAERGLQPAAGGELVLATDPEMARRLGRRRDPQAVLVTIQAQNAAKRGVEFFPYGEGLYLSGAIGREFLHLPAAPKKPEPKAAPKETPAAAPPTPGSVWLDIQGQPAKPWKEKGHKKGPAWKEGAKEHRRRKKDGE